MKRIILVLIVMIMVIYPSSAIGQGFEPGIPKSVTLGLNLLNRDELSLSWRNDPKFDSYVLNSYNGVGLSYNVNLYVRQNSDVYIKDISYPYETLPVGENGYISVAIKPKELGIPEDSIDLMNTSYSVRVRYIQSMQDILGSYFLADGFSASASLGLIYPYNYASSWAIEELDKALQYGFITNRISTNMRDIITREEFSEMMVSFYEARSGEEIQIIQNPFTDTDNENVLKAEQIGVITGYDDGTFKPDNPISRQDIALIIFRTLKLMIPNLDTTHAPYAGVEEIKDYAVDAVMFLVQHGIMKGDNNGKLNPLDHTTREQAAMLTVRAYEKFSN